MLTLSAQAPTTATSNATQTSTPQSMGVVLTTPVSNETDAAYGTTPNPQVAGQTGYQTTSLPTTPIGTPSPLTTTPVNTAPSASNVTNSNAYVVPPTPVDTTQGALSATANSYMVPPPNTTSNENGTATTNPDASSNARDQALQTILGNTATLATEGDVQNSLNGQFGVDQKQQNYLDAYNAYQSKKVEYAQNLDRLATGSGGTTQTSQAQISEIQRAQNADLANLSIIAQTAQGNYQGALDIVQRKLDAEFKPVQTQIDNLKGFLDANSNDLTDSQKTTIQAQIAQQSQQRDQLFTAKQTAYQTAVQYGATADVLKAIGDAQNVNDVYKATSSLTGISGSGGSSAIPQQLQGTNASMSDGTQYIDASKFTPGLERQQTQIAKNARIPILNSDDVSKVRNIDVTRQNLQAMDQTIQGLLGSGPAGRIGSTIKNLFGQITQSNPDVAAFNGYRTIAINTLQALGAGQGGSRITASEIATAVSNLPTLTDSIQTADKKLGIVNSYLDNWQKELLPSSKGNSTSSSGGLYSF